MTRREEAMFITIPESSADSYPASGGQYTPEPNVISFQCICLSDRSKRANRQRGRALLGSGSVWFACSGGRRPQAFGSKQSGGRGRRYSKLATSLRLNPREVFVIVAIDFDPRDSRFLTARNPTRGGTEVLRKALDFSEKKLRAGYDPRS